MLLRPRTCMTRCRGSRSVVTPRSSLLPTTRSYGRAFLEAAAALGVVLYLYLLAPDVLLDDLGVLHHVLADADLFLGHGALTDDDLFLGDGHGDLVLADLGLRSLAGDRHPLHTY